jgi:predicted transcriptional regulator
MPQKILSPLEQEVMNIVWELKDCSVRDVVDKLNQGKKLAYTTVATLLQRLFEKGLVNRNNQSSVLSYRPKVSKEMYGKKMAKSFIQTFMSSFGEAAIVSFAESIDKLPKDKKDYLLQLLEKQNEGK